MPSGVFIRTKEHLENMRKSRLGFKHTVETCKKISIRTKGLKRSEDTKNNIRIAKLGVKRPDMIGNKNTLGLKHTKEACNKMSLARKGVPHSEEWRKNLSKAQTGEKNHQWQGGKTPIKKRIRDSVVYINWRTEIFLRDNRTCVLCGSKKQIEADHYPIPISAILNKLIVEQGLENLYEKALKYNLLWTTENGRTLCHECHTKTETYGHRSNRTEQRINNLV